MNRVSIIGNAGGGKSTLARAISKAWGLPYHEADSFMWDENWQRLSDDAYTKAHNEIIAGDRWVIDGNGFSDSSIEERFRRADLGILIDLPFWQHCWLVAERYIAWDKGEAEIVPAGHKTPPPLKETFEMISWVDEQFIPKLRTLADNAEAAGTHIVRLTDFDAVLDYGESIQSI